MKLTMLGTGNALVTECYNTCFVLSDGNDHFMVDGGGGMTVLHQLKYAGLDWRQMRTIFVTHKHIDHLLGIIWMMRMICQHMREGTYEGEATIYAHDEVVALLRDLAGKLLQKKELPFLDSRLHLIAVADGEEKTILGRKTTFFDIGSTKAKQYGFCMELGSGEKLYEDFFREMQAEYPEQVHVTLGFVPAMARRIYGGADMFLMPSQNEPCGLAQMVAMRYGTIPVVRETGGLKDSVFDAGGKDGNGFTFKTYDAFDMLDAVKRACAYFTDKRKWNALVRHAMKCDYSWNVSAEKYVELYRSLLG